jgi:hypothetical protein
VFSPEKYAFNGFIVRRAAIAAGYFTSICRGRVASRRLI